MYTSDNSAKTTEVAGRVAKETGEKYKQQLRDSLMAKIPQRFTEAKLKCVCKK